MVSYNELNVGDPLAFVFDKLHLKWMSGIIAVSAVIAMASVLLVFQMGQPRIWMSMSRDGLLPKRFSKVHPKFKTPSYATIVTGFVVAIPALFLNLTMVTDLCSIGTLFAFVLVCTGVLVLQNKTDIPRGKFKTPYVNSKFVMPIILAIGLIFAFTYNKKATMNFLTNEKQINPHSPKELCEYYIKNDLIYGCGKPFRIINNPFVWSLNLYFPSSMYSISFHLISPTSNCNISVVSDFFITRPTK
jgi:amino acid transporter